MLKGTPSIVAPARALCYPEILFRKKVDKLHNSCKVSTKVGCLPWSKLQPYSIALNKADVLQLNRDDDLAVS